MLSADHHCVSLGLRGPSRCEDVGAGARDQPVPGQADRGDLQLPAEDRDPRDEDHRQGDGEGIHVSVPKLEKKHVLKLVNFEGHSNIK